MSFSWTLRATRNLRVALGLGFLLVSASCLARSGPAVGQPAPSLQVQTLDGRTFSTRELRGKVVVLAFWATWCAPCQQELPLLSAYAKEHADQGLQVIGISIDEAEQLPVVRKIAAGLSFPIALLGTPWAGDYGRIWQLPANFTIDANGILVDNSWNDDRPEWTPQRLQDVLGPMLKEQQKAL